MSSWKDKYKTLADFYGRGFDPTYYKFGRYEIEIDPDEPIEEINAYSLERQRIEYIRCADSFAYFATKYIKILHPQKGLIPFILYKYQHHVIEQYEQHRFNIIRKFRQGGLTTVTELWGLWRCLFKLDQQILFLSKTDSEAIAAGEIVNTAAKYLPTWLLPSKEGKWNDHQKQFIETGGKIHFGTPERARGLAITYLILDEAAFIPDMEDYWKAMYPTLSLGGNCIVISTVNGLGNWYADTYHAAKDQKNDFHIIDLHYTEHPDYNNEKWVKEQKAQLKEKGWQQEVLGSFLGSGETYIPMHIIGELQELTRNNEPIKRSLKKWVNGGESSNEWEEEGALWHWKLPQEGHEYILGIDSGEGLGSDADNSCIEVFDRETLEQVAEFYSNLVQPHIFAQIVANVGDYYNNGLVVVENLGPGSTIISNLENIIQYDNLYYDTSVKGKLKAGIKTSPSNRPLFLEAMQHRLMTGTVRINSRRFVNELPTFVYNAQKRRAEPSIKGKHDDAIMATCFALYVRDIILRDIPIGAEVPQELAGSFKTAICEEIKREIMGETMDDMLNKRQEKLLVPDEDDPMANVVFRIRRKNSALLREFHF